MPETASLDCTSAELVGPTLERAAFFETNARVFAIEGDAVEERSVPAPERVLAGPTESIVTHTMVLGDRAAWVEPVTTWAESAPCLVGTHRKSYLAWQCDGRIVLRIRRTHHGVEVAAGVEYSKPTGKQAAPLVKPCDGPIDAAMAHRFIAAAALPARIASNISITGTKSTGCRRTSLRATWACGLGHASSRLAGRRIGAR